MFEAYAVGVSLKLHDMVSPVLAKVAKDFEKLDVLIKSVQGNLTGIGQKARGIRAIEAAADASARAMDRASVAALELERRIAAIRAAGTMPGPGLMPVPGAIPGGGGGRGGNRYQHGGLHGGRIHAGPNGVALGAFSYGLAGDALVPLAATAGAAWLGYKGYEAAKDYQLEKARFQALGLSPAMNAEAARYASSLRMPGVSRTQTMTLMRDAQTIFRDSGSLHHAEMVLPLLAKMRFANETLFGQDHAEQVESKFLDMLKVIELRKGLNSTTEFAKQANMVQQVLTTSGGRVDATQYLNLMKTGGVAAKSLSNEALYYQLEPVIQEMGGSRVGTSLMSAYQNLIVGRLLGKRPVEELLRLGLLDRSKVVFGTSGSIKEFHAGALSGSAILQRSPVDFLEQVLLPAFAKKGITKEADVLQELATIFSNRTASNLFSTIYQQLPVIRRGEKASAQAMSIERANELAQKTATGQEKAFAAAWSDFKTTFGDNVLPEATKLIVAGTGLFRTMDSIMQSDAWKIAKSILFPDISPGNLVVHPIETSKKILGASLPGIQVAGVRRLFGYGDQSGQSPNVRTGSSQPVQVHTQINLDGRAVANVVSEHQANSILRPTGTTGFDGLMSPIPQALNY